MKVSEVKGDESKQNWFVYEYQRPALTVDAACFYKPIGGELKVLLIKRGENPYKGHYALPGGFVEINETTEEAMKRELKEETGLKVTDVVPCGLYDDVYRDTRSRVVTRSFLVIFSQEPEVTAGDDAAEVTWKTIDEAKKLVLAFDHNKILKDAELYLKRMAKEIT